MEIKINGENIDFKLENEKTFSDVRDAVSRWLSPYGMTIQRTKINDIDTDRGKPDADFPLEAIETIDFGVEETDQDFEYSLQRLSTIIQYFSLIREACEHQDTVLLRDLWEDSANVMQILGALLSSFFVKDTARLTEELDHAVMIILDEETTGKVGKFRDVICLIDQLLRKLESLFQEISYPIEKLRDNADSFEKNLDAINSVSVHLQTGNDREALDTIVNFIERCQQLVRLVAVLDAKKIIDFARMKMDDLNTIEFFINFNRSLNELTTAFEVQDTVLIGDLLEYELVPKTILFLKELRRLIP